MRSTALVRKLTGDGYKALLAIIAKVSHMSRWLQTEVRSLTLEVHAPIPVLDVLISIARYTPLKC